MTHMNNSHLIAGFFRYHREKLNYSLRGLVGDGKVVDLSSLSAFEHGKRTLTDFQLTWLFEKIGYDYQSVINSYTFEKEYNQILELIYLGETKKAEDIYLKCVNRKVCDTLGVMNFSLLKYVLSTIYDKYIEYDTTCLCLESQMDQNQTTMIRITRAIAHKNKGYFLDAIEILREAEKITYNPKIRAWIAYLFGEIYGLSGNYVEATVALLDAKQRYGDLLGINRLIQTEINLGNAYFSTTSYSKAEESYLMAYHRSLLLKDSSYYLTRSFNSLCWLYFDTNQYDKVNELLNNKPEEFVESRNTYFVLAWAYYKLDMKAEAIHYCQLGLKKFSNYSYVCMVYEYIEKACKGIKSGQDVLLRKIIETKDSDHDKLTEKLFTHELIEIYERRKNYEKALKYAKKLLNR